MKEKKVTISDYLNGIESKSLSLLLVNYRLTKVPVDLFFKCFGEVERSPEALAKYIIDENNGFELSIFGSRASGENRINAYNGMSNYQGTRCTLGSSHSRFHG